MDESNKSVLGASTAQEGASQAEKLALKLEKEADRERRRALRKEFMDRIIERNLDPITGKLKKNFLVRTYAKHPGTGSSRFRNKMGFENIRKIKKYLRWPISKPFPMCWARSRIKKMTFERVGDFSHSAEGHVCYLCQCRQISGFGTKGDLYGLGFDSGHLGTGYCMYHEKGYHRLSAEKKWKIDRDIMQLVGDHPNALKAREELLVIEARESELTIGARKELELILDTLKDFKKRCDDKELKEYVRNELLPASDVTRIQLAVKIAEAISKLNLNRLKMDSDSYIHVDELKIRLPQMRDLGIRLFNKTIELKSVNPDDSPIEAITNEWLSGLMRIWEKAKTGIR